MTPPAAAGGTAFASATLWIVDLDGVIWLSGQPIGDVAGAVDALRRSGKRVVFATNNSAPTTTELVDRLDGCGVQAKPEDLASSAGAAASLLDAGQSVWVLAEGGVLEALTARGVKTVSGRADAGDAVATVVGWTRSFDFDVLAATATVARQTGRLIGTNEDPVHPTPDGLVPGSGALLAAVATASGVDPTIAGKPHGPMASLMREAFGFATGDRSVVMVGDQPLTDGKLAERLGIAFGLVDSGVTPAGVSNFDTPVAVRAHDFVTLVRQSVG
jgi:HAD superfamily hydrolase (TIGR01450 family)